jgi:hypothetical protein
MSRATRPFRWFTPLLAVLLGGYMFFGRPFAYLSIPGVPAYIGDMVLAVGVVEAVRARSAIRAALAASPPLKFLFAFMVVCGLRFVVSFPAYGMDAIRDSAIWYYGIFAFLVETPRPDGVAPLRSAHNSHLTILARNGLLGLTL